MKIIKRGSIPEERMYQFQCTNCGTVAEASFGECRFSRDQRDDGIIIFDCPVCHKEVYVNRTQTMHGRPA